MPEEDPNDKTAETVGEHVASGKRFTAKSVEYTTEEITDETRQALAPYFDMMGKITNQWAFFETDLDRLIWTLADATPSYAACLTSSMGSTFQKLKCVNALLTIWPKTEGLVKEVNSFSGRMERVVRMRNRVLHDPIAYDSKNSSVLAFRSLADKNEDIGWGLVSISDYRNTNSEVAKLWEKFTELSQKICAHLASCEKPMPPQIRRP